MNQSAGFFRENPREFFFKWILKYITLIESFFFMLRRGGTEKNNADFYQSICGSFP
jgi:hypothetical protein